MGLRKNVSLKRKNPENRRAVGGQKTNQVGTLIKSTKRKLFNNEAESASPSKNASSRQIIKANSRLGVEASKAQLENRRLQYEQKQQADYDEAIGVLRIR